jgi:UDP-N-acetylmuramate dehydrogenase
LFRREGELIQRSVPLASLTTWQCGGSAAFFAEVQNLDELRIALEAARRMGIAPLVLGGGTNLLVSDTGINCLVIRLDGDFKTLSVSGREVSCGAGVWNGRLVVAALNCGLAGVERLCGIPGTVGGSLAGNAGVPGCAIGDHVTEVSVMTHGGETKNLTRDECGFGYRSSALRGHVITGARFDLAQDDPTAIRSRALAAAEKRLHQPRGNTAGSVFANPTGDFAGRLLESVGMKGRRIGGAYFSPIHSNFIVNECGTASDVASLIELGRSEVLKKHGVALLPEVRIWGEFAQRMTS